MRKGTEEERSRDSYGGWPLFRDGSRQAVGPHEKSLGRDRSWPRRGLQIVAFSGG